MPKIITEVANANCRILAKNCLDVLNRKYPGHRWMVCVDDVGGIVNITNARLSGLQGYTLHITKIDNDFKSVMRAGGEILERYRLSRGRIIDSEIVDLARNRLNGEAIHSV